MIKVVVLFFFFKLFFLLPNTEVKAQTSLSFCGQSDKAWSTDGCVTVCQDLSITGLSNGNHGFCTGKATKYEVTIRRIDIGTSAGFNGEKCTLFEGTYVIDFASVAFADGTKTNTQNVGNIVGKCNKQITYDRIYLYTDRKVKISGNTYYPGSSSKIARTTSACSTDTITTITDLSWLDSSITGSNWSDSSLCAGRRSTSQNTYFLKSNKSSLSTADFANSSNQENEFDDFKQYYLISNQNANDDGFYMESGSTSFGARLNPSNLNQTIFIITKDSNIQYGLPIKPGYWTRNQKISPGGGLANLTVNINYYSANRDRDFGLKFWFMNIGGIAYFMGTSPSEDGMYIHIK